MINNLDKIIEFEKLPVGHDFHLIEVDPDTNDWIEDECAEFTKIAPMLRNNKSRAVDCVTISVDMFSQDECYDFVSFKELVSSCIYNKVFVVDLGDDYLDRY